MPKNGTGDLRWKRGQVINEDYSMEDPATLQVHPDNPRRGNLQEIVESIRRNGFYGSVIAQKSTRRVLVGNHRFLGARDLRIPKIPVIWVDVDDARAKKILLADNRTGDLGAYDDQALMDLLREVQADSDLRGTGWRDDDLDRLLSTLDAETEAAQTEFEDSSGTQDSGGRSPFKDVDLETNRCCPRCGYEWKE